MGGAISMRRSRPSGDLRQRLLRARGETYGRLLGEVEDGYSQSPGGLDKGLSSLSCEGQVSFYKRKGGTGRDLFGWLWKLVPVNVSDEAQEDEEHYLMHPAQTSQWDDPWGEVLAWKFDPTLAYTYEAYVRYPEEFGSKSGLSEEEVRRRLTARGLLNMADKKETR
uniref:Protein Nef n=1 Tax=Simian immunodeficiency virus TaxID=11723 RepID=Q8AC06_SIV|nr:Nef [Simian immunodeficiency virus]AAN04564.1 Nef [Simian immunodeficiency virus]AAN04565.1 Nef [Simian immunodeficiency virus]